MFLLKLSLRAWKMAPLSQFFSAIAVGFLLLLLGFLFWMQQGLKPILFRLQAEQVVTAYLKETIEPKDENQVVDAVKEVVGNPNSVEIKLVNAPQFLNLLKGQYPDLGKELEGLGPEAAQLVPRYISVSGIFSGHAFEKIKSIPGIESVESSKDRYHHIVGAFSAMRWIAHILIMGVCVALLTGMLHLSRMNVFLHQDSLSLLQFWGAGKKTLMTPGALTGLSVGLAGGIMAAAGWLTAGSWLTQHVRTSSLILKGMPTNYSYLTILLLLAGGGVGLLSGVFGSLSLLTKAKVWGGVQEWCGSLFFRLSCWVSILRQRLAFRILGSSQRSALICKPVSMQEVKSRKSSDFWIYKRRNESKDVSEWLPLRTR